MQYKIGYACVKIPPRSTSTKVTNNLYIGFRDARHMFEVDESPKTFIDACKTCRKRAVQNVEKLSHLIARNHVIPMWEI